MINIENLTKFYGETCAVDNISFQVEKGEVVGFLGPNGAGKTTTMKVITCFMPPTKGTVTVGGFDVMDNSIDVRRMIGYLPEQNPLYGEMNVVDFLRYIAELRDIEKDKQSLRIREVIDVCGVGDVLHKNINELSKGYRQRVGLAQAMVHDPEILILDEPTIGLDPNQVLDIRHLIKRLGREKTVILSTHILTEVQATCDRAVIINNAKIVADSSLAELQKDLEGKQVINLELLAEGDVTEKLTTLDGIDECRAVTRENSTGRNFAVTCKKDTDAREAIFKTAVESDWIIIGMSLEVRSLEDVFHQLTMAA